MSRSAKLRLPTSEDSRANITGFYRDLINRPARRHPLRADGRVAPDASRYGEGLKLTPADRAIAEDFERRRLALEKGLADFRRADRCCGGGDNARFDTIEKPTRIVIDALADRVAVEVAPVAVDAAREVENGNVPAQGLAGHKPLTKQGDDKRLKRGSLGCEAANVDIFQGGILQRVRAAIKTLFARGAQ